MKKIFEFRYYQLLAVGLAMMALLACRLFVLTVVQHEKWNTYADNLSQKKIYTSAPRGEILDRYGRVLAGNVQTFLVKFDSTGMENDEINRTALAVLHILEQNGDSYIDEFPIVFENGGFEYTYQQQIDAWLTEAGMPTYYTAEMAFNQLRQQLEIDESYDVYEAQSEMQTVYNVYPPISVRNMTFTQYQNQQIFLGNYGLSKRQIEYDISAEEAFEKLRAKFEIGEEYSVQDARKIMIVRNEISDLGYMVYMSATIASDISQNSIITLEEESGSLPGISVVSETKRYYPYGSTASHILGYLGKISESDKEKYVTEKGYNPNDLIGQSGIESSYEDILRGTDGVRTVQVNVKGEMVHVISEVEKKKGDSVYLTIDAELQKTAEDALGQALAKIRSAGTFESKYGNYKYNKAYRNANVGAVVAIEVETGDVLAMASNPDFDPNLFATGISGEDWQALQSQNPRDYLAPAPLYNVAARTAVQPGSTFKMVVATAAMKKGLSPDRKLRDGGYVMVGNRPFNCLIWTRSHGTHGMVDLAHALEVSCNYYFYDIATGRDYYAGKSLGYDINMQDIMESAAQYGLGKATGIEITETVTEVPSAEKKTASMKSSLNYYLTINAENIFEKKVFEDKEKLQQFIDEIVSWTEENPTRGEIIKRLPDCGVREDMVTKTADTCKFDYFNQAKLTRADEFNIAIGQGENAYTPLQMANYIATIGNDGYHNEVSVVKAVENQGKKEKKEAEKVDISQKNLDAIVDGMVLVANGSSGSLRGVFGNFPVTVAAKSGTAEKSGVIQPSDEVEYIRTHLRQLDSRLRWEDVETEMNRLLTEEATRYRTKAAAVDQAVKNLSGGKVTQARINQWKSEYDNFAWVVAMAPAEDPKIAVAVLIFQGGTAGYAAPVAREVIGKYLRVGEVEKASADIDIETSIH